MSNDAQKFSYLILQIDENNVNLDSMDHDAMNEFGCLGIEEFSVGEEFIDSILGMEAYAGGDLPEDARLRLEDESNQTNDSGRKYYFEKLEQAEFFAKHLQTKYSKNLVLKVVEEEVQDWNETWRKHFQTIEVSQNMRVVPDWEKDNSPREGDIIINPGQGFGTGSHETTFLCLKLLEEISPIGRFMDLGCGSGILGIAAQIHKNIEGDYCDIDEAALENCRDNLALNNISYDRSAVFLRDRLAVDNKYALVFANILIPVLKAEKQTILSLLDEGAYLILSGVLVEQVEELKQIYGPVDGLNHIKDMSKGDWHASLWQKGSK